MGLTDWHVNERYAVEASGGCGWLVRPIKFIVEL